MALVSNWDGTIQSGIVIPAGLERQVFMRKLFDAILQVTQNWAEVTESSPTPAALQPYASTVPDTVDNANSTPSTGQRCVAYLTTDPEVASGKAVSFALYMGKGDGYPGGFMTLLVND